MPVQITGVMQYSRYFNHLAATTVQEKMSRLFHDRADPMAPAQ